MHQIYLISKIRFKVVHTETGLDHKNQKQMLQKNIGLVLNVTSYLQIFTFSTLILFVSVSSCFTVQITFNLIVRI